MDLSRVSVRLDGDTTYARSLVHAHLVRELGIFRNLSRDLKISARRIDFDDGSFMLFAKVHDIELVKVYGIPGGMKVSETKEKEKETITTVKYFPAIELYDDWANPTMVGLLISRTELSFNGLASGDTWYIEWKVPGIRNSTYQFDWPLSDEAKMHPFIWEASTTNSAAMIEAGIPKLIPVSDKFSVVSAPCSTWCGVYTDSDGSENNSAWIAGGSLVSDALPEDADANGRFCEMIYWTPATWPEIPGGHRAMMKWMRNRLIDTYSYENIIAERGDKTLDIPLLHQSTRNYGEAVYSTKKVKFSDGTLANDEYNSVHYELNSAFENDSDTNPDPFADGAERWDKIWQWYSNVYVSYDGPYLHRVSGHAVGTDKYVLVVTYQHENNGYAPRHWYVEEEKKEFWNYKPYFPGIGYSGQDYTWSGNRHYTHLFINGEMFELFSYFPEDDYPQAEGCYDTRYYEIDGKEIVIGNIITWPSFKDDIHKMGFWIVVDGKLEQVLWYDTIETLRAKFVIPAAGKCNICYGHFRMVAAVVTTEID